MKRRRAWGIVGAAFVAGTALAAQSVQPASSRRVYVTDVAATLVQQGVALPAPTGSDAAAFESFRTWLVATYPRFHSATRRTVVGDGTLIYEWSGSDA